MRKHYTRNLGAPASAPNQLPSAAITRVERLHTRAAEGRTQTGTRTQQTAAAVAQCGREADFHTL
jgi:hypothetical protein